MNAVDRPAISRVRLGVLRFAAVGPIMWILSIQFFVVEVVVANAWKSPAYSWRINSISDLGATRCGQFDGRYLCSPLHGIMNSSLVVFGITMTVGSMLTYRRLRNGRAAFAMMTLAGLGPLLVGVFPETSIFWAHLVGQDLAFMFGNIAQIVFSFTLSEPLWLRRYSRISGATALVALFLFLSHHRFFLGLGGMERVVAYPLVIWLIVSGVYVQNIPKQSPPSLIDPPSRPGS